tara:strand:- start:11809 stop:12705 length:897 start_codon:yes stop_codon:yes gene_type:complete
MSTEKRVNLFLVGAAKSGTTSVAEMFKTHKDIFVPYYKEPFYFIEKYGINEYNEYIGLYENGKDNKYWVDASTGYLSEVEAARKIYQYNKDAKIIIILRNPIDFCISYWKYMRINGNESLEFSEAISEEIIEKRNSEEFYKSSEQWPRNYHYLPRAKYFEQVQYYLSIFGEKNVKIILFEELINGNEKIKEIYDFLGVDDNGEESLPKENSSGEVRPFFHFLRFSKSLKPIKKIIKRFLSTETNMKIRKKSIQLSVNDKIAPSINVERIEIARLLDKDVERLKKSLPWISFSAWKDFR